MRERELSANYRVEKMQIRYVEELGPTVSTFTGVQVNHIKPSARRALMIRHNGYIIVYSHKTTMYKREMYLITAIIILNQRLCHGLK